jgi:hypothetical protein
MLRSAQAAILLATIPRFYDASDFLQILGQKAMVVHIRVPATAATGALSPPHRSPVHLVAVRVPAPAVRGTKQPSDSGTLPLPAAPTSAPPLSTALAAAVASAAAAGTAMVTGTVMRTHTATTANTTPPPPAHAQLPAAPSPLVGSSALIVVTDLPAPHPTPHGRHHLSVHRPVISPTLSAPSFSPPLHPSPSHQIPSEDLIGPVPPPSAPAVVMSTESSVVPGAAMPAESPLHSLSPITSAPTRDSLAISLSSPPPARAGATAVVPGASAPVNSTVACGTCGNPRHTESGSAACVCTAGSAAPAAALAAQPPTGHKRSSSGERMATAAVRAPVVGTSAGAAVASWSAAHNTADAKGQGLMSTVVGGHRSRRPSLTPPVRVSSAAPKRHIASDAVFRRRFELQQIFELNMSLSRDVVFWWRDPNLTLPKFFTFPNPAVRPFTLL